MISYELFKECHCIMKPAGAWGLYLYIYNYLFA